MILKIKPLSANTLKNQKKCCANKCLNCPYHPKHSGSATLLEDILDEFCPIKCTQKVINNGDCQCYNNLHNE